MRKIKYIHPEFPNSKKQFEMALDLANISTILNNGNVWDLVMENGQRVRMDAEAEGGWSHFVDECQAAKLQRDLSNENKRGR